MQFIGVIFLYLMIFICLLSMSKSHHFSISFEFVTWLSWVVVDSLRLLSFLEIISFMSLSALLLQFEKKYLSSFLCWLLSIVILIPLVSFKVFTTFVYDAWLGCLCQSLIYGFLLTKYASLSLFLTIIALLVVN